MLSVGKSGMWGCNASGARLFGQPAFCAVGNGRFGEAAAELRPLRLQNQADLGAHNPKPGRASVPASPNFSGNLLKSGLARTLALPNGRCRGDLCRGGQDRVGMARVSRIIASSASGAPRWGERPGSKSAVTNALQRLSRNPRPGWVAHDGALWSDAPCAPEPGKDAFHRVPFIPGEVRDAVERVLTILEDGLRVLLNPFQDHRGIIIAQRSGVEYGAWNG